MSPRFAARKEVAVIRFRLPSLAAPAAEGLHPGSWTTHSAAFLLEHVANQLEDVGLVFDNQDVLFVRGLSFLVRVLD